MKSVCVCVCVCARHHFLWKLVLDTILLLETAPKQRKKFDLSTSRKTYHFLAELVAWPIVDESGANP